MVHALVILSGGLDSSVVAYHIKKHLHAKHLICLFFNYNQRTFPLERFCAKRIARALHATFKEIDLRWLGDLSKTLLTTTQKTPSTTIADLGILSKEHMMRKLWWVPCRNALFIISALASAESLYLQTHKRYTIYSGIKQEGHVPMKDTTPTFLKRINQLAEEATYHGGYRIEAPLMHLDKDQVVELGEQLHVPWQSTFSCYVGKGYTKRRGVKIPVHCGTCANCRLRQTGFYWANVPDPSIYYEH